MCCAWGPRGPAIYCLVATPCFSEELTYRRRLASCQGTEQLCASFQTCTCDFAQLSKRHIPSRNCPLSGSVSHKSVQGPKNGDLPPLQNLAGRSPNLPGRGSFPPTVCHPLGESQMNVCSPWDTQDPAGPSTRRGPRPGVPWDCLPQQGPHPGVPWDHLPQQGPRPGDPWDCLHLTLALGGCCLED